jgi:membrane protein
MARAQHANHSPRGRHAEAPKDIPKQGWRDVVLRVKDEQKKDNLSIVAAGVAFYSLLAIFPALVAAVSIYGLVADPADVQRQLEAAGGLLPPEAYGVIEQQLSDIVTASGGALSLGLIGGIVLALWSAARGMKAMIIALNIVYGEEEQRGIIKYNGLALLLTLGAVLFFAVSILLIVVVPALLATIGFPQALEPWIAFLRWPLLAVLVIFALALLYRYAPDREEPRWRWVSWGSVLATVLWLVVSALFSFYVSRFGNFNETYGSVGAIVILLMWFFLTAYVVLIGAEFNAELEHQTTKDSTGGKPRPRGERGARMADTVGKKP